MFIEGGLPPGVSKLINVAKYRHFDFDMGFVTALQSSTAGFERGVGDVTKTEVFDTCGWYQKRPFMGHLLVSSSTPFGPFTPSRRYGILRKNNSL